MPGTPLGYVTFILNFNLFRSLRSYWIDYGFDFRYWYMAIFFSIELFFFPKSYFYFSEFTEDLNNFGRSDDDMI